MIIDSYPHSLVLNLNFKFPDKKFVIVRRLVKCYSWILRKNFTKKKFGPFNYIEDDWNQLYEDRVKKWFTYFFFQQAQTFFNSSTNVWQWPVSPNLSKTFVRKFQYTIHNKCWKCIFVERKINKKHAYRYSHNSTNTRVCHVHSKKRALQEICMSLPLYMHVWPFTRLIMIKS